jgi:hypothetical protein
MSETRRTIEVEVHPRVTDVPRVENGRLNEIIVVGTNRRPLDETRRRKENRLWPGVLRTRTRSGEWQLEPLGMFDHNCDPPIRT